ncbi:hypothetical protein NEMIN01_2230 [Nematocida minor]|uniref:uncharacterized protein n=1 Tax=Nematocida minor TaxID=1912983 RepID=UPI00221E7018|nr:uncharacterized protein NEMIN01_2230 [Nematocida minor]KAI5192807.1 hypothetical protein NEMIN01_2230 [Nematocida minor]
MRNKELKAYAKRKVMMLICIYLLVIRADASETLEPAVYEKQLLDAISKRKNEIELLENQLVVKGFKGPEPVAKEEKAAEKKKAQNHKDVSDSDPFYSSYSHGEEKSTDNKNAKTSPTRASSDSKRDAAMHAPSKSSNKQQMGKSSDSSYDSDESTTKAEKPENVHKQQNKEPKNASMQPSGKSEDVDQSDGKSSEKEPEQKKNEDLSAKKEKSKEDVRYASADGSEDDEDTLVSSHAQMKKNSTAQENDKEKSGQHKASESEAAQSPVQKSVMEPSRQSEAESKTDSDSLSETGNGTSSQTQPEPKAKKDDSAKTDHDAASQLRSELSNGDDSSLKSDHETTSQSQSESKTNDSPKAKDEERKSEPEPKQETNESSKSDHETANQPESRKPESEPKSKEETNDLSKTEDKESKSESSQEANKTPESGSSSESNGSSKSEDKKGAQSDPVHESSAEPKPSDEQQGDQTEKKNGTEPTNHRENSTAQDGGPAKSIQENEKVPSDDAQTEQNKQPGDKKTEQDAVLEDEHKSTDKEPTASSETESKSDEDKKSTPAINAEPEEKAKENEKTDAQSKEKDEAQEADKQTDAAASGQSPGDSKLRLVNSLECVSFSKIHIWGLTLDEEMKMKMDIKDLQPVKSSENVDIANFLLKHNQHLFTDKMDAISDSLFTECASRVVSLTIDLETYSEKDLLASYNWSVFKNLKGFEIRGKGIAEHPDADGPIVNVLSEIEKIFSSDSRKDAQNTLVLSHMRISNFADSLKKLNKVDLVFHEASYLFSLMDKTIDVFVSEISANISTLTLSRFVIEDGTDLVDDHAHIATIKTITVENCSEGMINRLLQHCFFRAARTHVLRNNDLQNLKQYGLTPFLYLESLVLIGEKAFTRLAVEEISGLPTLNYIAVFGENKDLTVDAEIFDREKTRIRSFGISTGCNLSINGKIKEEWLEGTLLREYLWKDERANCIFEIDIGEKPKQTTMTILSPSKYLGYPDKLSLGPILSSLDKSSSLPVQMYTVSESTAAGENEENGNEKVQEKTENLFKSLGITVAPSFV